LSTTVKIPWEIETSVSPAQFDDGNGDDGVEIGGNDGDDEDVDDEMATLDVVDGAKSPVEIDEEVIDEEVTSIEDVVNDEVIDPEVIMGASDPEVEEVDPEIAAVVWGKLEAPVVIEDEVIDEEVMDDEVIGVDEVIDEEVIWVEEVTEEEVIEEEVTEEEVTEEEVIEEEVIEEEVEEDGLVVEDESVVEDEIRGSPCWTYAGDPDCSMVIGKEALSQGSKEHRWSSSVLKNLHFCWSGYVTSPPMKVGVEDPMDPPEIS